MKNIVIYILNAGMEVLYFFMKLKPTKRKVTFISRQGNVNSLDFQIIQDALRNQDPTIEIVVLNRRFRDTDSFFQKISYCFHILVQMHHIASSKVVVLESYCMPISMLHHKKSLKVIQMWHALGSLKKFGYSVAGKEEGSKLYKVAKMHCNYDYILTSSEASAPHFAEAFHYPLTSLKVIPLPRVDLLMDSDYQEKIKAEIQTRYPHIADKKIIVYAPTFRKNGEDFEAIQALIDAVDYEKYHLVLKLHPLTKLESKDTRVIYDQDYPTLTWLFQADYVISDYSAIIYEAALLAKPLFFYTYDFNQYEKGRDFYLSYETEMPGLICRDVKTLIKAIEKEQFDLSKVTSFANKYVHYDSNHKCTQLLVDLIIEQLK